VSIQFPAVDQPAPSALAPAAEPEIAPGRGRVVLLVEDETAVLLAAARILGGHGYTVLVRGDPLDAVKVLADSDYELAILVPDIVMPGLSGIELAGRAKELRPGLPVLFTTGYSEELVFRRGTLPAGSGVVQKPFTRRGLLVAVAAALGERPADA